MNVKLVIHARIYVCAIGSQRSDINAHMYICDHLWINQPSTTKCKFWVRPKITARSARSRYLVYVVGVIYGVLATLCRSTIVFGRS